MEAAGGWCRMEAVSGREEDRQTDRRRGEYRVTVVVALAGSLTSPTFTPDPLRCSWHSLTPSQVTREPRGLGDRNMDLWQCDGDTRGGQGVGTT